MKESWTGATSGEWTNQMNYIVKTYVYNKIQGAGQERKFLLMGCLDEDMVSQVINGYESPNLQYTILSVEECNMDSYVLEHLSATLQR